MLDDITPQQNSSSSPNSSSPTKEQIQQDVQTYYGSTLESSDDLKTSACCSPEDMSDDLKRMLANLHDDVLARYYGCGLIAPLSLKGARVLDLGCGAGRDVYVLSQMVGEEGAVVGVDMTEEQLAAARKHQDWHREKFGYKKSNITFLKGDIEALDQLDLEPASFDVVVSNCVVNLASDKLAVLKGVQQLLKPGGEFYFSDVYADRRLPGELRDDPVIYGECLGGALYWGDFDKLAKQAGFDDPRLESARQLDITDQGLFKKLEAIHFYAATFRLFNAAELEPNCEDYGQAVIYRGGIEGAQAQFILDNHHIIDKGRVFPVCGNTWHILKQSRFAPHFEFIGDFSTHYGIFPGCGTLSPFAQIEPEEERSGCC